jgi:hypothetical protein
MRLASPAILALALALAGALPLAHAQQKLAPGLWETKMTVGDKDMQAAMAQARAQMANMPPEQRKMMEGMMAKQGVGLSRRRACASRASRVMRAQSPAATASAGVSHEPPQTFTLGSARNCGAVSG